MPATNDGAILLFSGAAVAQRADLCLNVRHRAAGCTLCVTTCPVSALALVDGRPMLDPATCIRCGLCLHHCPTQVFTQHNAAEPQLVRAAEQLPRQPITLVCALHPTPQSTAAPVSVIVQHRRCLAALSVEQILALSQDGERAVWLDDTPCTACPLGQAQAVLQQTVETANHLLQTFGRPAALCLQSAHADQLANSAVHRPLIDGGNPPVSRRGLFAALGRAVSAQTKPATPALLQPETTQPQPVHAWLPQRISVERTALRERMNRWARPEAERVNVAALPFADVQANPALCSACSLCARFCPTGALHFAAEETRFTLCFQPSICIDCPICTVACPENAIRVGDTLSTDALVTSEWLSLVEGVLTKCHGCGAPTAERPHDHEAARCYACRQGAGVVQPLRDGAGLMADLLQRLPKTPKEADKA